MNDLFLQDSLDIFPIVFSNRVFYTPTSFVKTALLYLQEIGNLQEKEPHTFLRTRIVPVQTVRYRTRQTSFISASSI